MENEHNVYRKYEIKQFNETKIIWINQQNEKI